MEDKTLLERVQTLERIFDIEKIKSQLDRLDEAIEKGEKIQEIERKLNNIEKDIKSIAHHVGYKYNKA
jgi:archaellum component FlaC